MHKQQVTVPPEVLTSFPRYYRGKITAGSQSCQGKASLCKTLLIKMLL